METQNLSEIVDKKLEKILEKKELSDKEIFSAKDRIELSKNIVSEKVEKILKKEIMVGVINNKDFIEAKLEHGEFKNEEKIKDFLQILGARNIQVQDLSFKGGDYSGDTYWVKKSTLVKFNY